jgi:hypothetical protein
MSPRTPRGELPPDWFCAGQSSIEDLLCAGDVAPLDEEPEPAQDQP